MKKIIIISFFLFPGLVKCQMSSNVISQVDFFNIKINNITLSQIQATNGKYSQVDNLFSHTIETNIQQPEESYYYYTFNGFNIGFSESEISGFEITSPNWKVMLLGKTIEIGSHLNDFGNVKINHQTDYGRSIVYQYCDGCNSFLSFYINSNDLVYKIVFVDQT